MNSRITIRNTGLKNEHVKITSSQVWVFEKQYKYFGRNPGKDQMYCQQSIWQRHTFNHIFIIEIYEQRLMFIMRKRFDLLPTDKMQWYTSTRSPRRPDVLPTKMVQWYTSTWSPNRPGVLPTKMIHIYSKAQKATWCIANRASRRGQASAQASAPHRRRTWRWWW